MTFVIFRIHALVLLNPAFTTCTLLPRHVYNIASLLQSRHASELLIVPARPAVASSRQNRSCCVGIFLSHFFPLSFSISRERTSLFLPAVNVFWTLSRDGTRAIRTGYRRRFGGVDAWAVGVGSAVDTNIGERKKGENTFRRTSVNTK